MAQITAFRAWEHFSGERFAKLGKITQPCLVMNGVSGNMEPSQMNRFQELFDRQKDDFNTDQIV